jgi:AbrB family looped-hinge helix DNA binding protein
LAIIIAIWHHKMAQEVITMKTTIDRFGRIVVPKEMRKRFGLMSGSQVEIDDSNEEIVVRHVSDRSPLQVEDGLLVFEGEATADLASWVSKVRENRDKRISGSK